MKLIKKSAIALALSAVSFGAFAMTSIDDAALSQVSGQDGVSIAADLNINIGSFTYTDKGATAAENGSVSFNNIAVRGAFIMQIDVLAAAAFNTDAVGSLAVLLAPTSGATAVADATTLAIATSNALGRTVDATGLGPDAGDVVRFAFPKVTGAESLAHNASMSITVDSITTGNGGKSFGSVALKNFDLQGTKVWMFGH
ncbi:DUF6160 family protein [Noviherbaspirillum autotrophicum]|uniref:DUF6160 domain-containing protein n=1 Tax=Noviherbaspirillum autotrophicum TaxID=709839 RepID=A0A0C2BGY0_9BURK|nr:DUF6160 family protein [Noviherbaspirillum autotrophicum]KIF80505.1 hypothetical protein TSA66_06265 [Noviherbaspirillum autotrophicum]